MVPQAGMGAVTYLSGAILIPSVSIWGLCRRVVSNGVFFCTRRAPVRILTQVSFLLVVTGRGGNTVGKPGESTNTTSVPVGVTDGGAAGIQPLTESLQSVRLLGSFVKWHAEQLFMEGHIAASSLVLKGEGVAVGVHFTLQQFLEQNTVPGLHVAVVYAFYLLLICLGTWVVVSTLLLLLGGCF